MPTKFRLDPQTPSNAYFHERDIQTNRQTDRRIFLNFFLVPTYMKNVFPLKEEYFFYPYD